MVLDIIILIIIIFSAVWFSYRGFARAVISMFQWIACVVCALLFTDDLSRFLSKNTGIDDAIRSSLASRIEARADSSTGDVPAALKGLTENAAGKVAEKLAGEITSVIMTVIALLLIILIIKLVCVLLARMFSKEHRHGILGALDTGAGFLLGFGMGIFYTLILLGILAVVLHALPSGAENFFKEQLRTSYISGRLYEINPVRSLLETILHL